MKTYRYLISAALVLLGFTACQKGVMPQPQEDGTGTLVEVTVGADFVTTKTTMNTDGDVLWSAGDSIAVTVGENHYKFAIVSGAGTTSARFAGAVTEADAAILKGTETGTVTAYYPTSGTSVPTIQTYAEGTFADGMNPMTATFDKATKTLTFTNNAAVVRIKGVSATATNAVLTYTVGGQNHTVTMALTPGETAKDLYFVVVPGTKDFQISLDGASAVYETSAVTEAGKRYDLDKAATWVGSEDALKEAINNASSGDIIKLTSDITLTPTSTLALTKSLTINLNGKVLSTGSITATRPITITGGTVTIQNGTINGPNIPATNGLIGVMENGNLTLSDVEMNTPAVCVSARCSTSVLTIESGEYTSTGTTSRDDYYCYCTPVGVMNQAKVYINGGTFTGGYYSASIYNSGGTITITGGTFNKGAKQTAANQGNLEYAFMNDGNTKAEKGTINISGDPIIHGSFRGRFNNIAGHYGYLNIHGGTFDSDCVLFNFNHDYIDTTGSGYTIYEIGECPNNTGKCWELYFDGE